MIKIPVRTLFCDLVVLNRQIRGSGLAHVSLIFSQLDSNTVPDKQLPDRAEC